MHCLFVINYKEMAILENLFTKGTHPRKFCTSKISQYTVVFVDMGVHGNLSQFDVKRQFFLSTQKNVLEN